MHRISLHRCVIIYLINLGLDIFEVGKLSPLFSQYKNLTQIFPINSPGSVSFLDVSFDSMSDFTLEQFWWSHDVALGVGDWNWVWRSRERRSPLLLTAHSFPPRLPTLHLGPLKLCLEKHLPPLWVLRWNFGPALSVPSAFCFQKSQKYLVSVSPALSIKMDFLLFVNLYCNFNGVWE